MDSEKLKQIEEIYHSALEVSPSERPEFLKKTCGTDEFLLREVESLLAAENNPDNFLGVSLETLAAEMFGEEHFANLINKEIGHYKIIGLLGKGGMGEVYLAEDTKLDRKVALKILPPEFAADDGRMKRFIREAKSASALNHPNIITIYEISEFEETNFIAAEFINGKTLNEYAKNTPLSYKSAVEIAFQIASALNEAHSAGIIHRDIKPDNVMIRDNGLVKILDFGIAKPISETEFRQTDLSKLNEDTEIEHISDSHFTGIGTIVGTANYMSPEQAAGKKIDARTDIFSFGVVLYELLSKTLPFKGATAWETIDAILQNEPKPLSSEIPSEITKIIDKCLKKDRDKRYQTIEAVLIDLEEIRKDLTFSETSRQPNNVTNEIEPNRKTLKFPLNDIAAGKSSMSKLLIAVLAFILPAFSAYLSYQFFTPNKQIKSIAVMPFVNQSVGQDVEYLSDGMTETLINRLSNIPNLSIKARSTVFTYKDKNVSPQKIGLELKVDAVLFGQMTKQADELKLHLELVETTTENILWSENYERKMDDLASLQRKIAEDVADKLRLKLTIAEQKQVTKTYTTNSEAHQLYLRGRFHWNKRNIKDFERAIEYFKQAVEKDPNYALAFAGLADTYTLLPLYGSYRPNEYMPLAKKSAQKALELDKNLAEAHASLGRILNSFDFDWKGAEEEFSKSIKLNPNYPTVHQWYAEFLAFSGRHDEALKEISKALELDPFSLVINRMKGNILSFAGKHDEAIAQLNKTIELYPENALVRYNLGDVFAVKGMHKEAVEQYLIALKYDGQSSDETRNLQKAYQNNGWQGFWKEHLKILLQSQKDFLEQDRNAYIQNEELAFAFAANKEKDKTLEYLN
jgi:serine/threonine-protein kinase